MSLAVRDLLPDATGALLGWATLAALTAARARWRQRRPDAAAAA